MACYLPRLSDRQQGQFPVQSINPYLTDVLLQGMVVWVGHFRQASSLPLFCKQGQFAPKPLPFDERFYVSIQNYSAKLVSKGLTQLTTSGSADIPVCLNFAG